jgi:hypothetical protein
MTVSYIAESLKLTSIVGRNWHIQGASVINGEGLIEGMEWITNAIQ